MTESRPIRLDHKYSFLGAVPLAVGTTFSGAGQQMNLMKPTQRKAELIYGEKLCADDITLSPWIQLCLKPTTSSIALNTTEPARTSCDLLIV